MSRIKLVQDQQIASLGARLLAGWRYRLELPAQVRFMIRLASACLVAYWLAIFTLTHLPSSAMPRLAWSDKVYHAGAFAGLAFLLAWAIPTLRGKQLRQLLIAGTIAVVYGCLDEFTQQFIPGRSCDIWDVAADCVGVAIGLVAYTVGRQILAGLSWGRQLIQTFSR